MKKFAKNIFNNVPFPVSIITLLMCTLSVFFSGPGQTYFISVFLDHYIVDFGWSRSMVSGLYSAATLISGSTLFLVGRLADRYGPRKITLIAGFILGVTGIFSSFIISPFMLFIAFFLGRLSGQGTLNLMPATIIPRWFNRKRALAFSLMSLGGVVGTAALPPLNNFLIDQLGWRVSWRVWGLAIWLIFLPLAYLFLHNDPGDIGPSSNSKDNDTQSDTDDSRKTRFDDVENFTLGEAMRTFAFWGIIFIQLLQPMISTGITFHFISLMETKGIVSSQAPFILSVLALTSLPATLLIGLILNKLKTKYGGIIFAVSITLSMICLFFANDIAGALTFAVLHGIAQGVQAVWGGLVWPDYFGMRHLGSIRGFAMTSAVISSSLGALIFGVVFDNAGTYSPILLVSLVLALTGLLFSVLVKKPKHSLEKKSEEMSK